MIAVRSVVSHESIANITAVCDIGVCKIVTQLRSDRTTVMLCVSFIHLFSPIVFTMLTDQIQRSPQSVWQKADAVCFDVDSTVCKDEGLDELAEFCGVGKQVKEWTLKAMGGDVTFREALSERLKIVTPSEQQVETFVASRPPNLSDGIVELVSLLLSRQIAVFLISGGFRRLIEPVAASLNIPKDHIFANRLLFENGQYSGFDTEEPTSESGGKPRVMALLKRKYGFQNLVMIGDGATDMEACPPADAFIGYGGNVVRDKVKNNAAWFVTDFQELISALQQPARQTS